MPDSFVKATLLDKYYQLRDESVLPAGAHFQIGSFRMGHGFLEGDGSISDIPANASSIPSVFFTGTPTLAYANGRTVISCLMPAGSVANNTTKKFSCIGLYDKVSDTLVAILAGGELTLTSIDKLDLGSYIDNALNQ